MRGLQARVIERLTSHQKRVVGWHDFEEQNHLERLLLDDPGMKEHEFLIRIN